MIHDNLFNISLLRSVSESLIHLTKSQLITGKFFRPLYITSTRPTTQQTAIEKTLEKTAEPALQYSVSQQATSLQVSRLLQTVFKESQRLWVAQAAVTPLMSNTSFSCLIQRLVGEITTVHRVFSLIALQFTLWTSIVTHFITEVALQSSNICRELV